MFQIIILAFRNLRELFVAFTILACLYFALINEETLVAFCFLIAIYYLHASFQSSVVESLNERSASIKKELSTVLLLRQENIEELEDVFAWPLIRNQALLISLAFLLLED